MSGITRDREFWKIGTGNLDASIRGIMVGAMGKLLIRTGTMIYEQLPSPKLLTLVVPLFV